LSQSERYHTHAADCLLLAERTHDLRRRAMLLNMAECWRALAARALLTEEGVRTDTAASR